MAGLDAAIALVAADRRQSLTRAITMTLCSRSA